MIRFWRWGVLAMASLRLAHINLLWADEDYHLAAAIQLLHGRVPYRDFWYDKPPLAAFFYALIGGYPGWPLRLLDVVFVLACCWMAHRLARSWWGESEGRLAALLLAFFTTFYLPAATVPFAVDGLMLLPHLAAIYFAQRRMALWSGVCCALGLLTNVKAVFVVATCAVWLWADLPLLAAGLAVPLCAFVLIGWAFGALPGFYQQVWVWGLRYAAGPSSPNAASLALRHCLDWLGFHGALLAGVVVVSRQRQANRWRLGVWLGLSCLALVFGNHFAPRYFLQLLPVMVVAGARGITLGLARYGRTGAMVLCLLLVVPLVRFGPRYVELISENLRGQQTHWADAAMDVDSQQVSRLMNALKKPGDTLFVWGYRPDDYVYTRMMQPGRFGDSQPLDGVPADRHLTSKEMIFSETAKSNQEDVARTSPTFIVDGLGLLNPNLGMEEFPEMRAWLKGYKLVATTRMSRVYHRH